MFWRSPLFDLALIISTLIFLKHFLLRKDLTEEELLLIKHSHNWIRFCVVISIAMELSYVVGADIALLDGEYYIQCLILCVATIYIGAIWATYIGYKYGPKNYEYTESLKTRIQAAIVLPLIFILMYFF